MKELLALLRQKRENLKFGGGIDKIKKLKEKGKMSAWERIEYLLDPDREYLEIGMFAGEGMYKEHGGCINAGCAAVLGYVKSKLCVIVSNDATVKAGAWFPISAKKNLRAQEIAMENNLPIIYLVDSAGVFLPLQDEIFPDKEHFGRIFRNNARMSSMGIPQIAAIMGSCVAGGAYLPIMSDYAFIVEGTGSVFLAGPYLVKSAIGETVDAETLGGASTHSEISGVTDNKFPDDQSCLDAIKNVIDKIGGNLKANFDRKISLPPKTDPSKIVEILPEDRTKPYRMQDILNAIVDAETLEEYKPDYGKTIVCGLARIDGWAVGIVANQREIIKAKKPGNTMEMQMGGVIYSDSADKAARFIMNCNQQRIPLVFFQDVTGFMVGSRSEQGGIIKDGAKMVNAMANSVVPKFTFIVGNSYGAGNYAMCGKAYDPRLIYAWPTAQMAVMSGAAAGKTLFQIQESALKAKGQEINEEEKNDLLKSIEDRYNEQLSPYYAAARLWVDGIIAPEETRKVISMGIEAANEKPILDRYNVGVIQV
ncbi:MULTISPECIES: acyl-CoA carboxylase subunit beta [Sphingobacterium]|uniref:acyl-CoA carboxylase subunit beta n=1 Tax=Sphingobacterium TaxID=28453 RepID=UPI0008A5CE28|nr:MULTISPECIES: acyl-CoA carboxylase subunit beta [Sphingobacterium]OFV11567.1 methylcrotonoyl-CoA carboxylase [Sphingobacterium sp. HMSC13C05]QRQ62633.1 acyl-CoA carboxylase subunit beta [Sphingobacterium multivorum]HAF36452.1 acyl-CoA carboxylase subunit beta [Sphingobacterium sp.]HAL54281.1 acyl-CoA carboxylase subunit beta [Sphingobacterium sp.]